jgi:hypothetical protein
MDEPVVVRRLRDVGQKFSDHRRTIVLTSPKIEIPAELRGLVEFLELPVPDRRRLRQIIDEVVNRLSKDHTLQRKLDPKGFDAVVESLRGLTEEEAERALSQALVTRFALCPEIASDVLETKKSLLRRSEMLEFVEAGESFSSVGGIDNLKHWLTQRRGSWEDSAREFGLEPPHGVIILGVQGCGKSLCAQAVAGEWNLPLVKFDTAAVYDKYIGETEKRIRKVFDVAEGLAPCILWIDEWEKIFAGSGADSASVDAGVSSRLLASFLSWMQDRKAPVFVAATCNNVTALPPELIRKGRFDDCSSSIYPIRRSAGKSFPSNWRSESAIRLSLTLTGLTPPQRILWCGNRCSSAGGTLCCLLREEAADNAVLARRTRADRAAINYAGGRNRCLARLGGDTRRAGIGGKRRRLSRPLTPTPARGTL